MQSYFETLESDGHLCFIRFMIKDKHYVSRGAFHLSELAGRTIGGPVILTTKSAFSEGFC